MGVTFWTKLLDTSDFPARWVCGRWTSGHGWLHIVSDLGIWSAYFAIPCVLLYFLLKRNDLPFRAVFLLFGAFILLCGLTHLMEAIIFWWPGYRLAGLLKAATAIVSWTTVIALTRVAPHALNMRSPEELQREIEAREQAEEQLRRTNAELEARVAERTAELTAVNAQLNSDRKWFATTLKSIGDAVVTTDVEGRVVSLNPVAESLTGWSEEEAISRPLAEVCRTVDEQTGQTADNLVMRSMQTGEVVSSVDCFRLIARDGREMPIDDKATPLRTETGELLGGVLVFRDVSERRLAEQNLRASEERFAAFMSHTPVLAWAKDEEGRYVFLNGAFEREFDVQFDHWESKTDFDLWPEEIALQFWDNDRQTLSEGTAIETVEETIDERGLRVWRSFKFVFSDAEGRTIIGGNAVDITQQQRLEKDLREVAARLSEADRRKDEFLATLAHELRNPLAPIRTGLEVMRLAGDDPETIETVRETMERQAHQLTTLIDDLMDVSRVTRGKFELRREETVLSEVIRSAVEAVEPFIDSQQHELTIDLPEEPILLLADPHRLAQVVSNLLSNAAKYTPPGGTIDLAVQLGAESAQEVTIAVRDNGLGIPEEMLGQIFEMFTQIDREEERTHAGLGIGLTLVKSLVEMHGGTITAESEGTGRGSLFRVTLQTLGLDGSAPVVEPEKPEESKPLPSHRVLVVDDNKDAVTSLETMLTMLGQEVRVAHDGIAGMRVAEEFRPRIVLLDLGMPRMNGFELAKNIRDQEWGDGSRVVLVALTGWGQQQDRERTDTAGFDRHFVKPIEPRVLRQLLANLEGLSD